MAGKYEKVRKRARKTMFRVLGYSRYAHCHWCGCEIVWVGSIRRYNRIEVKGGFVTYRTNAGTIVRKAQASVDHLQELRNGGDNDLGNLRPSCARCNNARSKTPSPYPIEERRTCPFCGGRKMKGRARCNECAHRIVIGWKVNQTLSELAHFIDPLMVA